MINKDRVQMFIDALRSDDYVQGEGALEYVDRLGVTRNCCLGVATRVAMANGLEIQVKQSSLPVSGRTHPNKLSFNGERNYLPQSACEWYGFENRNLKLGTTDAINMNDNYHASFGQIADAIEKEYLS